MNLNSLSVGKPTKINIVNEINKYKFNINTNSITKKDIELLIEFCKEKDIKVFEYINFVAKNFYELTEGSNTKWEFPHPKLITQEWFYKKLDNIEKEIPPVQPMQKVPNDILILVLTAIKSKDCKSIKNIFKGYKIDDNLAQKILLEASKMLNMEYKEIERRVY